MKSFKIKKRNNFHAALLLQCLKTCSSNWLIAQLYTEWEYTPVQNTAYAQQKAHYNCSPSFIMI